LDLGEDEMDIDALVSVDDVIRFPDDKAMMTHVAQFLKYEQKHGKVLQSLNTAMSSNQATAGLEQELAALKLEQQRRAQELEAARLALETQKTKQMLMNQKQQQLLQQQQAALQQQQAQVTIANCYSIFDFFLFYLLLRSMRPCRRSRD
jgi:hypothetical protein